MVESPSAESLSPQEALSLGVKRIGGQSATARLLDVAQSTVWEWLEENKPLPAEHVLRFEAASGVSRHDLRPDIYPRGLQDDIPFRPAAKLPDELDLVADDKAEILQGADDPEPAGKSSKAAA